MKIVRSLVAIAVCALCISSARASVTLATWNLTTTATSGLVNYAANSYDSTDLASAPVINSTTPGGDSAPSAGSGVITESQAGKGNSLAGQVLEFSYTSKPGSGGFSSVILTYTPTLTHNLTTATMNWTYAIGSGTQSSIFESDVIGTGGAASGTTITVDLTGINFTASETLNLFMTIAGTPSNGGADAQTMTFGGISSSGSSITPVPEPIAYALPLFGLIFIGGTAGWFYLGRRQKLEAGS